jgi:hypothetical protein
VSEGERSSYIPPRQAFGDSRSSRKHAARGLVRPKEADARPCKPRAQEIAGAPSRTFPAPIVSVIVNCGVGRRNWTGLSCGLLINMMEASEHGYPDDLSSLIASMRRICRWCAGRTLPNRAVRAPVVEITDILGQDLRQMAVIEDEHVVQALRPDRSHPALGEGVGSRRSDRRARLSNTETTHPLDRR